MPEVSLTIDGKAYAGWTTVRIRRGIEQIAGTFELGITEIWSGQSQPWPIRRGQACTVAIDGEVVITGYVDDVLPQFDAQQHGVTVVGRDKTGDLVDCSAIHATGEWTDRSLVQILRDLAKPFGVQVSADVDAGVAFSCFALQEGETVFEAMDRAARMRGVLLVVDAAGNLHITRAGKERIGTALVQGQNVMAGSGTFSLRDRFSQYFCKGQDIGSDGSTADQNASPQGKATDPGVPRYRPLIVVAEEFANAGKLKDRALWEAAVRLGRSARPTVTVQGWQHAAGLWGPNRLVPCEIPYFELSGDMLIVSTEYALDDEKGTVCNLELARKEAFELLPIPDSEQGAAW